MRHGFCRALHMVLRERYMLGDDVPLPKEKCEPINIRDSYNSKGAYVDFCSLYPLCIEI